MSEVIEQEQVQDDAAEIADAMAGYNARGDETPPAEKTEPEAQTEGAAAAAEEQPAEQAPEVPAEPSIEDKLKALKDEVNSMKASGDPAVRKLYGEIGNINRTIQQMQAAPKGEAPATDEVAAALAEAEAVANEFPELGGPMVKVIKALAAKHQATEVHGEAIEERVTATVAKLRAKEAAEALAEEHPDFEAVRDSNEFSEWMGKKTPDERARIENTLNPIVAAKALTEFKADLAAKQKAQKEKQDRLATNVTPRGVPKAGGPSIVSDEQALWDGYNGGQARRQVR